MDFLRGLVTAQPGASSSAPAAPGTAETSGLLSDWNSYSRTSDLEAGTASTAQHVAKAAEEAGSSLMNFFTSGVQRVQDGVTNMQAPSFENS
jgi:hypothetical protein